MPESTRPRPDRSGVDWQLPVGIAIASVAIALITFYAVGRLLLSFWS